MIKSPLEAKAFMNRAKKIPNFWACHRKQCPHGALSHLFLYVYTVCRYAIPIQLCQYIHSAHSEGDACCHFGTFPQSRVACRVLEILLLVTSSGPIHLGGRPCHLLSNHLVEIEYLCGHWNWHRYRSWLRWHHVVVMTHGHVGAIGCTSSIV